MDRTMRLCVIAGVAILAIAVILITIVNAVGLYQPAAENTTTASKPYELYITNYTALSELGPAPIEFTDPPYGNYTATVPSSSWPWPQPREDVIVYFREMPSSLEDFASSHGVKLIFSKPDIKMAAFETTSVLQPGKRSAAAQDFIANVSNDPKVESAEFDWFMFTDTTKNYTGEPTIVTPEDLKKNNTDYVPDEVIVGFWKMPPSLDEFGANYGGALINSSVNHELKFATFNTDNITNFIENVSTDPYVSSASPNGIIQIPPGEMENIRIVSLNMT